MLKRGKTGRRAGLIAALAALGVMACVGLALAASDTIVAGPAESFSLPAYNTDQGQVVQFQDNGGTHNVTARQTGPDGGPLFRSATISGGSTPVNGTQFLSAGDYAFFCTVHPTTMQGTLRVSSNGTPQARPSSSLKLKTKSIAQAIKKGLKVVMTPTTRIDGVTLTAKLGKSTIGKTTLSLAEGFNSPVFKLSKAGKSKLRGRSAAKVGVTADIPFGSPVTAKGKLK
jgi:plastocyanin